MIKKNNETTSKILKNNQVIARIFKGVVLCWEYIVSCFGRGIWINTIGWKDEEPWKNR